MEEALLWCVIGCVRAFGNCKVGICTRWRANWIGPAITVYCTIMRSHLERHLWLKDLYSCEIMTQKIEVTARPWTDVFGGAISGLKFHWTGLGWPRLKSQLNNPQVPLTSGNSYRKAGQIYLQTTPVFGEKIAENPWTSDSGQRGSFWWIKSLRNFHCAFFFV